MNESFDAVVEETPTPDLKRTRRQRPAKANVTALDRLPPHSVEAEQGVLGCMLLSPLEAIGDFVGANKSGSEVFYDLRHRTIYEAVVEMYQHRAPVDLITLQQHLKDHNQLDGVGGLTYLVSLQDAVPSAANLTYYREIVREKYFLRRLLQACTQTITQVYDQEGDIEEFFDHVETSLLRIGEERIESKSNNIKDLVVKAINQIEEFQKSHGALSGVSTGFADLDKMTTGFHPGEMIVIAARPSMGKTSLAMNIAEHVALDLKQPVAVFSLEMTAESLVMRMLCSRSRVNLRSIREGFIAERDFPKLTRSASELASAPLFIDDSANMSILELRAKGRRMYQQYGIKLFVIDYLQLLRSTAARAKDNRQQEIADISSGIKSLAKELGVPVIVLSQLNRELEKDKSRKPRLSDLRESGSIEQDADLVGLLYKPNTGDDEDGGGSSDESGAQAINLLIAKQRNGPTGDVCLTFLKGYTRYESAAKVSASDVPADG